MAAVERVPGIIEWETLEATWRGLVAIRTQYLNHSERWAQLGEALQCVEAEMGYQGFAARRRKLTGE